MSDNEKNIKELGNLYVSEMAYWNMSNRNDAEIEKRKVQFLLAHTALIEAYIKENTILSKVASDLNKKAVPRGFTAAELIEKGIPSKIAYVIADYKHINAEKTAINEDRHAIVRPDPVPAHPTPEQTLKKQQLDGLRDFQCWLYRNANATGKEYFGAKGSPREYIEHNFLNASREIQLRTLFYLENNIRKQTNVERILPDNEEAFRNYVPKIENLKGRMLAHWTKLWKRVDGSGSKYYWNKLEDAFKKAQYDDLVMNHAAMPVNLQEYKKLDKNEVPGGTVAESLGEIGGDIGEATDVYDLGSTIVSGAQAMKNHYISRTAVTDTTTDTTSGMSSDTTSGVSSDTTSGMSSDTTTGMSSDTTSEIPSDTTSVNENNNSGFFAKAKGKLMNGVNKFVEIAPAIGASVGIYTMGSGLYRNVSTGIKEHEHIRRMEGAGMVFNSVEQTAGLTTMGASLCLTGEKFYNSTLKTTQKIWKNAKAIGEKKLNKAEKVFKIANLVTSSIKYLNSYYRLYRNAKEEKYADEAVKLAESTTDPEKEKVIRRGNLIKRLKEMDLPNIMHGVIAGFTGIGVGVFTAFTLGAPVIGQIVGIFGGLAYFVGEYVVKRIPQRAKKRDVIDTELVKDTNGDIETKKNALAEKIKNRLESPNLRPEVKEKIEKHLSVTEENGQVTVKSSHKHHLGNILRREAMADNRYMFMDQAYDGVIKNIAKESMDNVYGKSTGPVALTEEQKQTLEANRFILKSLGVATKGLDEKSLAVTEEQKEEDYKNLEFVKV